MFKNDLLAGKRVLITGGATGLGKSMGKRFLELGASLYICGRREAVLKEGADELRQAVDSAADAEVLEQLDSATAAGDDSAEASSGGANAVEAVTWDIDVATFTNHNRVQYFLNFFQGPARERFTVWLSRMPRYETMIRQALSEQGLPEDLIYLALIESGFSNTAVSRVRAAGMWQFMRGTALEHGLKHDWYVDERADPRVADVAPHPVAVRPARSGLGRATREAAHLPPGPPKRVVEVSTDESGRTGEQHAHGHDLAQLHSRPPMSRRLDLPVAALAWTGGFAWVRWEGSWVPLAVLAWKAAQGDLGANPIEVITHATGDWTLRFLCITLAITPLRTIGGTAAATASTEANGASTVALCAGLVGGLGVTLLGIIADHFGIPLALKAIMLLPLIGLGLSLAIRYPR